MGGKASILLVFCFNKATAYQSTVQLFCILLASVP
jgi:hypothetical protein